MRTDNTRCERTARMTETRLRNGWQRFNIWIPPDVPMGKVRVLFKGDRGGINWAALVNAAVAHAEQHQEQKP